MGRSARKFRVAAEKKRVARLGRQHGLGLSTAYPTTINVIPDIRSAFNGQSFPSARRVAETLLTVPTHQWLSEHDREAIAECIGTVPGSTKR